MPDILKSEDQINQRFVEMRDGTFAKKFATEPLGIPGTARQLNAGAASANTELSSTCLRMSMYARTADIRYSIGSTSQTANASTSHFIAAGERIDVRLPNSPNIAIIRAAATNGVLEITELL